MLENIKNVIGLFDSLHVLNSTDFLMLQASTIRWRPKARLTQTPQFSRSVGRQASDAKAHFWVC